ncbi:MAG: 30S ribosomal protein S15 [Nanoarchaeota archaeon]
MTEKKADWIKTKPAELEKLILELHKEGHPPAKIGLILRDKHGIPKSKLAGKKILQILKENKLQYLTEKKIVQDKIDSLGKHITAHKHDYTAKRSLTKNLWAVKKLK